MLLKDKKQRQAIEDMYKKGIVEICQVVEPMIENYQNLDIQQCKLVINYLVKEREYDENCYDELDEENKKLKQIINLMAEDLKTDYHSKEWVIKNYEEKVK